MTAARIEWQATIPTGGYDVALTITAIGGPFTVTVPAGAYFLTDLLSTFKTLLDAASGADGVFTVSASLGQTGTGLVTISHTLQTFTLAWTDTELRDLFGFTGTLTPAALTFTGTRNARGAWLSGAESAFSYGNSDEGHTETDIGSTESPAGDIKGIGWTTRTVLPMALWSHVPVANARISGETTTGASFEQQWRWCQGGELAYFEILSAFRLYPDADSATYKTYRCARTSTEMPRVDPGWNGLYTIQLDRLVRVPGT